MGRGLIPTHAGKTPPTVQGRSCARAHPRSCGENERTPRHEVPRRGSPPLTRGKPVSGASPHAAAGLIPTHAGKTERRDRCLHPPRAHPRSRGENATLGPNRCPVSGSSPLTRGKLSRVNKRLVGPGLIPAHAGKTLTDCLNCCAEGAHPRSRGENAHVDMATPLPSGSSPLTRGKHLGHADSLAGGGLIPAHAGKTPIHTRVYAYRRAHPRSRGENRPPVRSRASWAGSSPLTRGKLGDDISLDRPHGLIPAHAGKTPTLVTTSDAPRAHPRSRGENACVRLGRGSL